MTPSHAELSSIASSLGELAQRVSALAEQANRADPGDPASGADLATDLFDVERSLKGALRRLERAAASRRP